MLKTRIITAIVMLAILVPALFWMPQLGWAVFVAVVAGVGGWEWAGFMRLTPRQRVFAGVGLTAICLALLLVLPEMFGVASSTSLRLALPLYLVAGGFWLLLVPFWLHCKWRLPTGVLGLLIGLVLILPAWAALVQLRLLGAWQLLAIMAFVWVADCAAYLFGRLFGRHKLAINISPGKTWEGAIGAALAVLVYGLVMRPVFKLDAPDLGFWIIGLSALTALSIVGDLFESLLKRQVGLKDSSNVLPGHGGVLDRIDSLTSTLPVLMFIYLLFL
ncbi:MAG: phosphatidate cytidylyltransferase, partial [Proteobacteria bacterium]|nr:phosphatidate cytidylyltransferase [Pseudomonadota bacterium]